MVLIVIGLATVLLAGAFFFVFRPLGLGPEPPAVLSQSFFDTPAARLDDLTILVDGEAAFAAILSAIEGAQHSIYVQTYIWKDDRIGGLVVEKLKEAAGRGVTVTIRKDVLGTVFEIGDMLKGKPSPVYSRAGLRKYDNISVTMDLLADVDHSKYFIVDGRIAIFGGMNIADEYHTQWHDYMAAIHSARWVAHFEQKALHGTDWPSPAPYVVAVNDRKRTEIRTAMIQIIDRAKRQVIVEHAYFSDDKIIAAVKRASGRGVDVIVILPMYPDTHGYANRLTVNRLLDSSGDKPPRIYLYPRMSHAKIIMVDGVMAAVGSANLTPRSMVTSKELTLFVHGKNDTVFIKKLRDQLSADIRQSEQVHTPFTVSAGEWVMAIAGKYIW